MLAIIFFIIIPLVLFFYFKYNIGSIIVILFLLFIFYYTPYSYYLEPTYWQFRNMCKLNELPNNEEKYNKILSYFDTDLDTLDWEELNNNNDNKRKWKVTKEHGYYKKGVFEYETIAKKKQLNSHIRILADFLSNKSEMNRYNVTAMSIGVYWHTKRFYPDGNEGSGFYWSEETLSCNDINIQDNMTPKGFKNDE
ncbi:hypothetical protein LS77_011225 [Helicobacter bilis]|uniref:Uncharacterized protein n=3 Tax=Helicobacter bilis TaxID=37372 RepID=A0A6D2C6B6_9HELI|nr:hypothetical protein [Helicobacter bilis]TLE02124.1 hypothetical protein LS77_011225 [Helicobacter bilis]TLE02578.1 hypothetical protein LS76_011180 [Helicobacter bilis]